MKFLIKSMLLGILFFLSINIFSQEKDSIYITGRIVDEYKFPMARADIKIKGTKIKVNSDSDGKYKINITQPLDSLGKVILEYSYVGFKTTEREIDSTILSPNESKVRDIKMDMDIQIIECYIYVGKSPFYKRAWNWVKNLFRKKD